MDPQSQQQPSLLPQPSPSPLPLPQSLLSPPPPVASTASSITSTDQQSLTLAPSDPLLVASSSSSTPQQPQEQQQSLPAEPQPVAPPPPPPQNGPRVMPRLVITLIWGALILMVVAIAAIAWGVTAALNHQKIHSWCKDKTVVLLDGTEQFASIAAAVAAAPKNNPHGFCIMIRKGVYYENVFVGPEKTNLAFIGDGIGETIIKPNRTPEDVLDTTKTATLWIMGQGFKARDLTIESADGPMENKGVALENQADQSVFYRCSLVGYNATIYASERKQFYHSCQIQGSYYFIFGDATVVFQNCAVTAIQRQPGEKIVIVGQSKKILQSKTGFVFHLCEFHTIGSIVVSPTNTTYLGSPRGKYSRVVIIQSFLDASIIGWMVNNTTPPTVYFGEYDNKGPGASIIANLPSVHFIYDLSLASQFTIRLFLDGNKWIPPDVPFSLDLE